MLLLAGEPSGDLYGGALAAELDRRLPGVRILGTGGARMRAAGVELLAELDEMAVMGFAELLPRLRFFRRLEQRLRALLDEMPIDLVVPIDYPGLNLRVAREAKLRRVPVLYYVAPKVWAWRPRRARSLAERADRVASILPFEPAFLEKFGVRVTYVGHPLLDREDDVPEQREFRRRWKLPGDRPLLALLPGSRTQELSRHLDVFVAAAELVCAARPDVVPVVGRAESLPEAAFAGVPFSTVDDVRALLRHAEVALVKSGTVTLEAALEGTPSVVAYRTSPATWALARRLLRVEHVALPNLVLGELVVPERLQGQANPEALSAALLPLLEPDGRERRRQVERFGRIVSALGPSGATGRVADLALELLGATS